MINEKDLKEIASELGVNDDPKENKFIKQKLMEQIEKIRVASKFNSLEKIRDIIVVTDNWEQMGMLTTTMKKKRHLM